MDAIDNGVEQFESTKNPKFSINSALHHRVARLNPAWNEK